MTTPPVMSSARWASNDARFGPRQVTLIDTRRDKALIRTEGRRDMWVLQKHLHKTEQQAFVVIRRAAALALWTARLRIEAMI